MVVCSVDTYTEEYGECQKCACMHDLLQIKVGRSANLICLHTTIKTTNGAHLSFYAYNEIATSTTEKAPQEVTKMAILKSKPFSLQHNKNNVIQSITR